MGFGLCVVGQRGGGGSLDGMAPGLGLAVGGRGFRVTLCGFMVQDSGFRVWGVRFGMYSIGFGAFVYVVYVSRT